MMNHASVSDSERLGRKLRGSTYAFGWCHGGKGAVAAHGVLALPLRGPLVPVGGNSFF